MKRYIPFKFEEEVIETDGGYFRGTYKGSNQYFDTKDKAEEYEKEGNIIDKYKAAKEQRKPKKAGHVNEHGYEYNEHDAEANGKKHGHTWELEGKDGKTEYAVKDEDSVDLKNNPEGVKIFKSEKERDKYLSNIEDEDERIKQQKKALKKDHDSHMVGDKWTTPDGKKIGIKYKDKQGKSITTYFIISKYESPEKADEAASKFQNSKK
jgi:hypothetical protein